MRYIRNKYEVWSHNYEKKSGYYVVWERKYEIFMTYICGIDIIFMRYKTRYLRVQMWRVEPGGYDGSQLNQDGDKEHSSTLHK